MFWNHDFIYIHQQNSGLLAIEMHKISHNLFFSLTRVLFTEKVNYSARRHVTIFIPYHPALRHNLKSLGLSLVLDYLKGRNFRGKKISRISAKFAKINSFFDPEKCRFAKIYSRGIFQTWWFAKINSRKILQKLMKCEYLSFCRLFYHLFTWKKS